MPRLIFLVALVAALAGCGRLPSIPVPGSGMFSRQQPSDPLPFPTRLAAERGSDDFRVSVAQGAAGLDAVRESVRFPATRHCLRFFGSSAIDWVSAPGQPEAWIGQAGAEGSVTYSGRCTGR